MSNSEQSYPQWQAESQASEGTSVDDYSQMMHQHTKAQLEKIMHSAGSSSSQKNATSQANLHHQNSSSIATPSSDSI